MRDIDGDPSLLFFRWIVDGIKGSGFGQSLRGQVFCDRGRQRGLSVINVTDRADI
jgi:hypothetical protein